MPPFIRSAYPPEAQAIADNMRVFNVSRVGPVSMEPLSLVAIDGGELIGGILGEIGLSWLHVETLWVVETRRGAGVGRSLLASAEAEARRRGCRGAFLDTFDWQAEPFYRKQGYDVFGRLEDCPYPGHVRTYMRKMLDLVDANA